jgi:hypothetical protein
MRAIRLSMMFMSVSPFALLMTLYGTRNVALQHLKCSICNFFHPLQHAALAA